MATRKSSAGPEQAEPQKPASFEVAMERLEQLAAEMEANELPLDRIIEAYEEGLRLVKYCSERLEAAEKRLLAISRDASGQPAGLTPGEITPSTAPASSASEGVSTAAGSSEAVRLY